MVNGLRGVRRGAAAGGHGRPPEPSAVMQMVEHPWGISAFEAARTAVGAVRGALREHGIADTAAEGSRLDLKTATEYVNGTTKFVGYRCQAAFAVESSALEDVESLLVDVVAAGANEIESVAFDVIAKRELRAEARRKAVAAARAKADLYAEAAGVRLGAVVHIEDVDPEQPGASRYRSHAEAATATAQDLAPGHIAALVTPIIFPPRPVRVSAGRSFNRAVGRSSVVVFTRDSKRRVDSRRVPRQRTGCERWS